MKLKSKKNNLELNLFWIIIFLFPLLKFSIEYNFLNLRFIDDTQGAYSYFQFIFNYFGITSFVYFLYEIMRNVIQINTNER